MPTDAQERPAPLLRLLGLAGRRLNDELHRRLDAAGFDDQRPADDAAFAHIPPEGIRLTELAERAGVTKQAMGEVVDSLEARGYVARRPHPVDGRAKLIVFAPRGWDAIEHALDAFDAMERELTAQLGAKRVRDLRRTLEHIIAAP